VVVELGAGVSEGLSVGERVYGQANVVSGVSGALAEFTTAKADQLARLPKGLNFIAAAALPLTGVSAIQVLEDHMKLRAGQKILIHGGAGGIGTMAIQIAHHLGAYVATTATGDGLAYVKNLGADQVIDYTTQRFEDELRDFDAVFDTIGGDTYTRSFAVLKPGGIIVSMLEQPNQELAEKHHVTAIMQNTKTTRASLDALTKLVEAGAVKAHVDQTFALDHTRAAFEALESGKARGKIVVEIKSGE